MRYHAPQMLSGRCRRRVAVLLLVLLPWTAAAENASERGRQIYQTGRSVSGTPITAMLSQGATPLSAEFLPCAGCHGGDGRGRPEGGVNPANITWSVLTRGYGHEHDYGRSHPAFDEPSLIRAVTTGIDPAGNPLDPAMPRYALSAEDAADLVAYLRVIESAADPGITSDRVRVGTLLPVSGELRHTGEAMRKVLEAMFQEVNDAGGIHGRRIELLVGALDGQQIADDWDARDFLRDAGVFALVSGYLPGVESSVARIAEQEAVPLIGPFTQNPPAGDGTAKYAFYLLAGLSEQIRLLARHVTTGADRLALIYPNGSGLDGQIEALKARLGREQPPLLAVAYQSPYFDAVDTAQLLRDQQASRVIFVGSAQNLHRLADESARIAWYPDLLLPGTFAGKPLFEISADYRGAVLLAYSSVPADHSPQGIEEFERLHSTHNIDYRNSTQQISAFVAAKLFLEGLKRTGRDLSREKLVAELERLTQFHPGLMPPLSYNSRRRIGALGGYLVPVDLERQQLGSAGKWIDLDQ